MKVRNVEIPWDFSVTIEIVLVQDVDQDFPEAAIDRHGLHRTCQDPI